MGIFYLIVHHGRIGRGVGCDSRALVVMTVIISILLIFYSPDTERISIFGTLTGLIAF